MVAPSVDATTNTNGEAEVSKERPILFSGPMVRAILEGRKTQTRRVVKLQPGPDAYITPFEDRFVYGGLIGDIPSQVRHGVIDCPHGRRQDRLWVRETWARTIDDISRGCVFYKADQRFFSYVCDDEGDGDPVRVTTEAPRVEQWGLPKCKPSIHMPRWASRITLEVTAVRVERLQQISEADAIAEGCSVVGNAEARNIELPREQFATLWKSINGPKSWDANPWVWVVEFERVLSATNPA